jgi:hypothetical protein
MNEKVLKSPYWVGHMSTNEQYLFCTARPSVIRHTPNARCVLQDCRTNNGPNVDNSRISCPSLVRQHNLIIALKPSIVNDTGKSDTAVFIASDKSDNLKRLL